MNSIDWFYNYKMSYKKWWMGWFEKQWVVKGVGVGSCGGEGGELLCWHYWL